MGGDGKSNQEARRGTATWSDSTCAANDVSASRSIPESSDEEEGDVGIPASINGIPKGSQLASLNSSHTSEEFLKRKKWSSGTPSCTAQSTKVEGLGVTRESVLSMDVVGLSGGVGPRDMTRA